MLPATYRLRRSTDFSAVFKGGKRRRGKFTSIHFLQHESTLGTDPRVGFVVSKAVGNAPTRNRVKRRLRAIMYPQLASLPRNTDVVIRSFPGASAASFHELEHDIHALLEFVR